MFERFNDEARRVVVTSQEAARRLNHGYVCTEHLLMALTVSGSYAAASLKHFGLDHEAAEVAVAEKVGRGPAAVTGHIAWTPVARYALELALQEATELGSEPVTSDHLLLGLLGSEEGPGLEIITEAAGHESAVAAILLKAMMRDALGLVPAALPQSSDG